MITLTVITLSEDNHSNAFIDLYIEKHKYEQKQRQEQKNETEVEVKRDRRLGR